VPALLSHITRRQLAVTGVLVFDIDGHDSPSDSLLAGLSAALTAANDVVPLMVETPGTTVPRSRTVKAR
jgi:hypothetical protein